MTIKLKTKFSWAMSTERLTSFLKANHTKISKEDFTKMALRKNFDQELKEEYVDKINFNELFLKDKLGVYEAYRLRDEIDWHYILKKDEAKYKAFWDRTSYASYVKLYEKKYQFMINWDIVTEERRLSEEDLENLGKYINWGLMEYFNQPFLNEQIIKKHIFLVDLDVIEKKYFFDKKFIQEMRLLQAEARFKFKNK